MARPGRPGSGHRRDHSCPAQAAFPGKVGPIAYEHIFIRESGIHDAIFLHGPRLREHPRRLAGGDEGGEPAFSPNGRLIAFTATGEAASPARSHVFVMKADGTGGKTFSEDGTEEEGIGNGNDAPAWGSLPR